MRPTSPMHNTSATAGIHKWNSPMPYLFASLALMLGLIGLALIILACSYRKSSSSSSSGSNSSPADPGEKLAKPVYVLQPEMEPKIVVTMPGDENPSYLAIPVSANIRHTEEV